MKSLQFRLSLGLLLSLTVIFIILLYIITLSIRSISEDYVVSRLEHDSETILTALYFDTKGMPTIDAQRIGGIYTRPFSGHYYTIKSGDDILRSRSLWDETLNLDKVDINDPHYHMDGPNHQPLLLIRREYLKQHHHIIIYIAEDLSPVMNEVNSFQRTFTLVSIGLLALLLLSQALLVHLGMRPTNSIRREIRALEQGELTMLSTDVPGELKPLVEEINRLLELMQQRMQRARNALGDLAHALKKPLTVLGQLREMPVVRTNAELANNLETQTESIHKVIERHLRHARLAGEGPGIYFDLEKDLPPLIDTLGKMYIQKALQINCSIIADIQRLPVDREDMLEVLGNLLDNACKWANHRVKLTIRDEERIIIRVEDDGPGVEEQKMALLTRRGMRLDETIEGHGLGLSIVRDILHHYQGELQFSGSQELGGLCVVILLPSATNQV